MNGLALRNGYLVIQALWFSLRSAVFKAERRVLTTISIEEFLDRSREPVLRGFLHIPSAHNGDSLLLTHGAGANCQSKLLVSVANEFAQTGYAVLRFDLPFRQMRRFGPPSPGTAAHDREGIKRAVEVMKQRERASGRMFVGGHSYGGRQASILAAEQPELFDGLILFSYPLHPPRKPEQLRTAHFPKLERPAMFVHGSRDPFASLDEMQAALQLIPAPHTLMEVEGVGHELLAKKDAGELTVRVLEEFQRFFAVP